MDTAMILQLIKARKGISTTTVRDIYLLSIINGVIKELEDENGIVLEPGNDNHQMFIVDYVTWRYENKDSANGIPKHLYWRFKNLYVHNGGGTA